MAFKETEPQFQFIDITLIEPDPAHPRQNIDENALKGLANSIRKTGIIHPILVQPANAAGRHTLIVGERRWRAAILAGEKTVPALVRPCGADEALELRVFENLGLGLRAPLEPREMANAIQAIADRFETREAAADHFGRNPTWLNQATAAANLSPKVEALLEAGKISSTGAAVQLEKLAQKNEAKAEFLIDRIEQLPEGEKLAKKDVDNVLSEEGGRRKKKEEAPAEAPQAPAPSSAIVESASPDPEADIPPWEDLPAEPPRPAPAALRRINPGKVRQVAEILGLSDGDEEEILARLIDEFLALKS
ncbi:MAG TPA: ParB/RepB/Spo0J family partition protein [Rhodocyclaceae bacterium]|nr:ParB/RepB/Spo0J family partition protein [Rhodocyclaceae bacterium]